MVSLFTSVLVIPFTQNIFEVFVCDNQAFTCNSTNVAVYTAAAALSGVLLLVLYLMLTMTYYDASPTSEKLLAKSHTYFHTILALFKILFCVFLQFVTVPLATALVYLAMSLLLCYVIVLLQPYYNPWMNRAVRAPVCVLARHSADVLRWAVAGTGGLGGTI